jgi:type IV secretory pathway VirB9-like protein
MIVRRVFDAASVYVFKLSTAHVIASLVMEMPVAKRRNLEAL